MASGKEIRNKIKSVQNTQKITKAMEMVAASKMRKAQENACGLPVPMREDPPSRRESVCSHITDGISIRSSSRTGDDVKRVGLIVVTTDKGLCGGLNTNTLRVG